MEVASAIRVRMRTVFVPYYIPEGDTSLLLSSQKKRSSSSVSEEDEDEDEDEDAMPESIYARELREAGNEEHTVILCVEVEHAGESRNYYQLEDIKVDVGGQGASTRLVTWGTGSPSNPTISSTPSTTSKERVFPLVLSPKEQYNLLYAVSFMRSPEMDEFSLARGKSLPGKPVVQELQRPVVIVISGRPVELVMKGNETHGRSGSTGIGTLRPLEGLPPPPSRISGKKKGQTSDTKTEEEFIYPTHTFPSRWNTTVDLAKQLQSHNTYNSSSSNMGLAGIVKGSERVDDDGMNDALPTPASPFPPSVLRSSFPSARSSSSRAGSSFQGGGGGNGRGDTGSGIIRSTTPLSMSMSASSTPKRSGTPTPTAQAQGGGGAGPASVAGNRKFTVSSMDAMGEMSAATTMTKGGNPLSPVNYKSKTSMLNPANQRDTYMQSGSQSQSQGQGGQQQGYQSFASVMGGAGGGGMGLSMSSQSQSQSQSQSSSTSSGGSSSLNPILGTLNTQQLQPQQQQRGLGQSYILPSVTFQQYAKSPTTYGPLSPPLPPVPSQAGFSFSGIPSPSTSSHRMSGIGFIGGGGGGGGGGGSGHGYEDSLSGDISLDFATFGGNNQGGNGMGIPNPPRTPAYPVFPSSPAFPPTPNWQGPINNYYAGVGVGGGGGGGGGGVGGNQAVLIGPSVEIRRDKMLSSSFPGSSLSGSVSVGSPGGFSSLVGGQVHQEGFSSLGGDDAPGFGNGNGNGKGEGEPVVVSVGLLADMSRGRKDGLKDVMGKIYPLDRFTLDIFVFNQSSWTRRFEVSYPDRRKLRKGKALVGNLVGGTAVLGGVAVAGGIGGGGGDGEMTGVLPLENRVRVG